MFRWWTKDARSFESSLLLDTGHSGAASIILAFLVIYNIINMAMFRNTNPTTLVPEDHVRILQSQITAFWSTPWFYTFREAIGQIFMLSIEICLVVMVLLSLLTVSKAFAQMGKSTLRMTRDWGYGGLQAISRAFFRCE